MTTSPGPGSITHLPLPVDAGRPDIYDPWSGWDDPQLPSHPRVDAEGLAQALRRVVRYGLPLSTRAADDVLPSLRSVIARSIHPYDLASRVEALNRLLVSLIFELDDENSGGALAILFAIAEGTRGTTLQSRRDKAAGLLNYDSTHFRKRVEPRLIGELAEAMYADLLRYKRRVRRAVQAEEATGDTPTISAMDFTHEEELISRIWEHVYGLRAELIAAGRLQYEVSYHSQAEDHRQAATRTVEVLRNLIAEYTDTYGTTLIQHGEAEYSIDALARLAGWQA
jgi:hypothetical protein